jgi:ABC-type transporter Mla maintaining outer membrane lipid asymmetry ATPase subunit MlaF
MITITHDPICVSEIAKNIVLIESKTISWRGNIADLQLVDNPYLNSFK